MQDAAREIITQHLPVSASNVKEQRRTTFLWSGKGQEQRYAEGPDKVYLFIYLFIAAGKEWSQYVWWSISAAHREL